MSTKSHKLQSILLIVAASWALWFHRQAAIPGAMVSATFLLMRFSRKAIRASIRSALQHAGRELVSESIWRTPLTIFKAE